MSDWLDQATGLPSLDDEARAALGPLKVMSLPKGEVLFSPGDAAQGYVIVLEGRIEVYLIGSTGREILLYPVEPGESCVQSTLGLLGGEDYSGEAITATPCRAVLVPREVFLHLMDTSPAFRRFVFGAFAGRMQNLMTLLERVSFQKVECRLAAALLALAEGDTVHATHSDLAARIGTAREVVSRRLEAMARRGLLETDRGSVRLTDTPALREIAAALVT